MNRRTHTLATVLAASVVSAALSTTGRSADDEPHATPQRPSLTFNAYTVPDGLFEVETGALFAPRYGAFPVFAKYGLTDALELEAGVDVVRWVDGVDGGSASIGDLLIGARWRSTAEQSRIQIAFGGWLKVPTAGDERGTGETDVTIAAITSVPLAHGLSVDANLWWSALGRDDGGAVGQGQAIAALWIPIAERWSSFVELALQKTAGEGDGGFIDAGIAYAASPIAVLDVAAGTGWSDGYPDWTVTAGWTVLLAGRP